MMLCPIFLRSVQNHALYRREPGLYGQMALLGGSGRGPRLMGRHGRSAPCLSAIGMGEHEVI
jgi:hypothetical protein